LIASAMIGVVIIGVASFGLATRQLHGSSSHANIVSMRAKTAMARISADASLAVGDFTDLGVLGYVSATDESLCFRQDVNTTPDTYADDIWICYYHEIGAGTSLERCNNVPLANVPIDDTTDCDTGTSREKILELDDDTPQFFQIAVDADDRLQYIEVTLQTLYDHDRLFHAVTNPRYTLTTQIQPEAHSR